MIRVQAKSPVRLGHRRVLAGEIVEVALGDLIRARAIYGPDAVVSLEAPPVETSTETSGERIDGEESPTPSLEPVDEAKDEGTPDEGPLDEAKDEESPKTVVRRRKGS